MNPSESSGTQASLRHFRTRVLQTSLRQISTVTPSEEASGKVASVVTFAPEAQVRPAQLRPLGELGHTRVAPTGQPSVS